MYAKAEKEAFIEQFKERTKKFAVRIIKMSRKLLETIDSQAINKQLVRSATSVAANYRAVCRARSKAEYFSKLSITIEKADESLLWLELLVETEIMPIEKMHLLIQEATEIVSVLSKARKNTYRS